MPPLIHQAATDIHASRWFNSNEELSLKSLLGRVVVVHAFQMLCPGCVSHGIPQALKTHTLFSSDEVVTIGLHSVFEHHEAMNDISLAAFLHEYRVDFPVAVDQQRTGSPIPHTMHAWGLQGTPSLIIIDREGIIRLNHFGRLDDMFVGKLISQLSAGQAPLKPSSPAKTNKPENCDDKGCRI